MVADILNKVQVKKDEGPEAEALLRHGNGEEQGGVLSPQSPTPTSQHILVPVSDTRRVKICYPSSCPSGVGYPRSRPVPSLDL